MTARRALFALMLATTIALLVSITVRRQERATTGSDITLVAGADVAARLGVASLGAPPRAGRVTDPFLRAAVAQYRRAARAPGASPVVVRRTGILLGLVEGREAAWQWFQAHPDRDRADLWRTAYAPGTLSPAALRTALARLSATPGSWYLELVRAQLYRKAGQNERAAEVLQALRARFAGFRARFVLLTVLGTMAGAAGLLLWLLIAFFPRRIPRATDGLPFAQLTAGELGEVFIFWFFVYTVGGWALSQILGVRPGVTAGLPRPFLLATMLSLQVVAALAGAALLRAHLRSRQPEQAAEAPPLFSPAPETGPPEAAGTPPPAQSAVRNLQSAIRAGYARGIAWGILTYLAAVPVLAVAAVALSRLAPRLPTPPNPAAEIALGARSPWEWALLVLMAVVVGPIVEEVYFRGVLYTAARKRIGVGWGVLVSAAAFAIVHPQLPLGFFPILALGALFAAVLELRRSLLPCVVAHMLNNGAALLLASLLRTP